MWGHSVLVLEIEKLCRDMRLDIGVSVVVFDAVGTLLRSSSHLYTYTLMFENGFRGDLQKGAQCVLHEKLVMKTGGSKGLCISVASSCRKCLV